MNSYCATSGNEIIDSLFDRYPELRACEAEVRQARELIKSSFVHDGKMLTCGNGGSAADSEHIVGELMKSFLFKRPVSEDFEKAYRSINGEEVPGWLEGALPAISLVSQSVLSTAIANDTSATGWFAQQVMGYGKAGDVLLSISTSGNSKNVVEAAKVARALNMRIVSLTGAESSALTQLSDICIRVPQREVFRIQELHLPVYHCLCAAIEADLFGGACCD